MDDEFQILSAGLLMAVVNTHLNYLLKGYLVASIYPRYGPVRPGSSPPETQMIVVAVQLNLVVELPCGPTRSSDQAAMLKNCGSSSMLVSAGESGTNPTSRARAAFVSL